jgi:hypothetical protein
MFTSGKCISPLPITHYSLPITCYPLRTTLPATHNLQPTTLYPLPATQYPLPVTHYPLPATHYLTLPTRHPSPANHSYHHNPLCIKEGHSKEESGREKTR